MIFGFTGTQEGMTGAQMITLRYVFQENAEGNDDFHFGDCVGADAEAFDIAEEFHFCTFSHPGPNNAKRAFKRARVICDVLPNLKRNRIIVDTCALLIATPKEAREVLRSGTWSTIRYAQKVGRKRVVIWPDGSIMERP